MKNIQYILISLLLIAALSACGDSGPTPERVVSTENQSSTPQQTIIETPDSSQSTTQADEPDERIFAVGDTIRVGNVEITVLGYRISEGESFFTPGNGNIFYLIDVAVANTGDSAESISSMLMFDLRDSDGFSHNLSFSALSMGRGSVDGAVLPEKVIRGELGYEIPADPAGYELQINPQVFGRSGVFSVDMDLTSDTPANPDSLRSARAGSELSIGQTFTAGNLEFVVNGIRTDSGEGFMRPDEGNTFFLVDVSVTNNGSEAVSISSMLMFTVRDSYGFSHSLSIGAVSAGNGSLDGDIMAGRTLRGELGYEIPEGLTGLELFVTPEVFITASTVVVELN